MKTMEKTKVVGVTYDGRQDNINQICESTDELVAVREPENPYDKNAIHIYIKTDDGKKVREMKSCGYINRHLAKDLAPLMDEGRELTIHNYHILGSGVDSARGVLIEYTI